MKEYYGYERFQKDTKRLIGELEGFQAEGLVGIARGGLTLVHALAEGLKLRDVQTLRTELYDEMHKRDSFELFGVCDFRNKRRVLVVDDIADSGETLKQVMAYLEAHFVDVEFQSVTLFYKPSSLSEPHFWINEAHNWIEFFWEADFRE